MTVSDIDDLYEIYSGKGITDYMEGLYSDKKEEEEFTIKYIENMYKFYEYGIWLVCLKENDKIIGRAGLSNREVDGENEIELGYVVGVPYQGKGYAYEACVGICEYAKDSLGVESLVCFIQKGNTPSCKLAEKLGFELQTGGCYVSEEIEYAYYRKEL